MYDRTLSSDPECSTKWWCQVCRGTHVKKKDATLEIRTQFDTVKLSDRATVDSRQPRYVHCGGQSMIYCDRCHYHQYTDHRFSSFLSWLEKEIWNYFIIDDDDNPILVLFITCFCPNQNPVALCLFSLSLIYLTSLRKILHESWVPRMSLMSDQVTRVDVRMYIEHIFA